MSERVQLPQGTYRLTAAAYFGMQPYEVEIDALQRLVDYPISPWPWDDDEKEYATQGASGWRFLYVFRADFTYVHLSVRPNGSVVVLSSGTYTAVV